MELTKVQAKVKLYIEAIATERVPPRRDMDRRAAKHISTVLKSDKVPDQDKLRLLSIPVPSMYAIAKCLHPEAATKTYKTKKIRR